jgi:hypothetical protein
MRPLRLVLALLFSVACAASARNIFVGPSGTASGTGAQASPLDLPSAITRIEPGDTILALDGRYALSTTVVIDSLNSGVEGRRKHLLAAPGALPILDFSSQPYGADSRGIWLKGDWWTIQGFEICHAGDNGMKIEGSHNRIVRCVFHHNRDTGLQLGFGHTTPNPGGARCAFNEIVNCDSYLNFDHGTLGGNADGFACKMHNGKGNVFRGCRAWHNSDDGWDLYETDWAVEIHDSWAWHNGDQTDFDSMYLARTGKKMSSFSGNGNGIKLGGNGTGGNSVGQHVVKRCIAFNNRFKSLKGFDQNSHAGGIVIHNSTAWNNGYNFMFETAATGGTVNEFVNNVSFSPKSGLGYEFVGSAILKSNSWGLTGIVASAADFQDTTEASARAPRQADGSLPANGFGRLVPGSDLIDKGTDVGLAYAGAAPDLGAFESGVSVGASRVSPVARGIRPVGDDLLLDATEGGAVELRILDARGAVARSFRVRPEDGFARIPDALRGLGRGVWLVVADQDGFRMAQVVGRP